MIRAALVILVACGAPSVRPGAPLMLDTVHDLARLLASSSVTVDAVVHRVGPVTTDHGADAAMDLQSSDPRFSHVQLWRDADTGVPSMLALDVAPTARLSVAELTRAFGAYQPGRPVPEGAAPDLIFQSIVKDAVTATLVARTSADHASVITIRLIREPRLD